MSTIFTAKVTIPAAPLLLERTFNFETELDRDCFILSCPADVHVVKSGTIATVSMDEGLRQIEVERASVL